VTLQKCLGMSGVNETCTVVLNGAACSPESKCSHLVLIFPGGEVACDSGQGYASVMANYSARGWAAACANYFETSTGSGQVPYYLEAPRLDAVVKAVTASDWSSTFWTGEYLLLEGISHGASSPLIVMSRFGVDKQPQWQGSRGTAGCFFDGTVNQSATSQLLAHGARNGGPCTFPVPYSRFQTRYCPNDPAACSDLRTHPDAVMDLVEDAPSANFSVQHWRLTECGSLLPPCTGDIIPMAPFEALCLGALNRSGHSCSWNRLPLDSHLTCHKDYAWQCRVWFESIFPRAASVTNSIPTRSSSALPTSSAAGMFIAVILSTMHLWFV
jgi:hypothetical protein